MNTAAIWLLVLVLLVDTFTVVHTQLVVEQTATSSIREEVTLYLDANVTSARRFLSSRC